MSNHKAGENPAHRKSKVSWAMFINPGLVGPKPRRISVGDGQRVNIPVPVLICLKCAAIVVGAGYGYTRLSSSKGLRMKVRLRVDNSCESADKKSFKRAISAVRTANQDGCSGRVDHRCTSDSSLRNSANKRP